MTGATCDVCRKPEVVGVACSSLGPVSWAYCGECLHGKAEPACMFDAALEGGGIEGVADWVRQMQTFVGGEYISFDDYAKSRGAA